MIIYSGYNYKRSSTNIANYTWYYVTFLYLDYISLENLFFS
jgi:hypothetical protein